MSSHYYSFDTLLNSMVRPVTSRPILGSSRANSYVDWTPNEWMGSPTNNWSINSGKDGDDCQSVCSPVNSPLKYSPRVWSQAVHTLTEKQRQTVAESLLFEDDSNDSRYEFQANGRDVPLEPSKAVKKPIWSPSTTGTGSQYQLFDGFSYAKLKSAVGEVPNRPKTKRRIKTQTFCSFCKNNNETPDVYNSHVVKDPFGRTTCPVLRQYDCPKCRSGGGDNGHTIRYCPMNKPGYEGYVPSVIKQLKNSRSADGKKRGGV